MISSHPYSAAYLVILGRKRWAIEGCFKTIKHRFGLHCFGQSTKLGGALADSISDCLSFGSLDHSMVDISCLRLEGYL
ncbi:hypothetical protein B9G53_03385 [Pseudanabaena sp. SR411]|nr:hypothetical protein B9G53_03385 [Pseudanabaena sp. SR411]